MLEGDRGLSQNREGTETAQSYIRTWRRILVGWLQWPEHRFDAWVRAWQSELLKQDSGLFYHEDALYYVLPLLVPERLAETFTSYPSDRSLTLLWHLELEPAIKRPEGDTLPWHMPDFDWESAKRRVQAVLEKYGADLPLKSEVTSYELRVLASQGVLP